MLCKYLFLFSALLLTVLFLFRCQQSCYQQLLLSHNRIYSFNLRILKLCDLRNGLLLTSHFVYQQCNNLAVAGKLEISPDCSQVLRIGVCLWLSLECEQADPYLVSYNTISGPLSSEHFVLWKSNGEDTIKTALCLAMRFYFPISYVLINV